MVTARRALARMVETLTDRDRFTVYAFDNVVVAPPEFDGDGLVAAGDRNRYRAGEFLARVEARGGTEMARPLEMAVTQLTGSLPGRDRVLVLVTDGQVGNEDQILRQLGPRLHEIRIFTLGIDRAVNEGFLKRLAALGGGSCELVESENRLDEVMDQVHRRIGTPVLTGLRLEPAGFTIQPDTVVPGRMPDLFPGAPLLIMGRFRGSAGSSITLQAQDETGTPWSVTAKAVAGDHAAVSAVWARGHIRELEDRFVMAQVGRAELEQRIVSTSLRFGVLCRFTAFVAVDRAEVVNQGGQGQQVTQAVEAPAGWDETNAAGGVESVDSCLMEFTPDPMSPAIRSSTLPRGSAPGNVLSAPVPSMASPARPRTPVCAAVPVAAGAPPSGPVRWVEDAGRSPVLARKAGGPHRGRSLARVSFGLLAVLVFVLLLPLALLLKGLKGLWSRLQGLFRSTPRQHGSAGGSPPNPTTPPAAAQRGEAAPPDPSPEPRESFWK